MKWALALLCLRNHDRVPTTLATGADLDLARLDLDTLFSPRFLIAPDSGEVRDAGARLLMDTDVKDMDAGHEA